MINFIVGGTHGLGKAITDVLQAQGQATFVVGRSYNEAAHGAGMHADLRSTVDADLVADKVADLAKQTPLDFWWVAGYGYNGDFADQQEPAVMAAVNFGNVLPAAQAAFRAMTRRPEPAHFVVISSTTGVKSRTDEAVYSGTKHAQVGFARSLGMESERLGAPVKVALFLPGGMQTPFWDGNQPAKYDQFLDPVQVAQRIVERVMAQREPMYEEVIERGNS
jgi:3-oxoacyl-[acyl-carrier protein] reductase